MKQLLFNLLYVHLHAYPNLSRRLVFRLRRQTQTFADLQSWIMGTDACLSAVRFAMNTTGRVARPLVQRLDRLEKQEAFRNLLRGMECGRVNSGSARKLRGRVAVGHAFLQQKNGRPWTKARQRRAQQRAQRAMTWLQKQAGSNGIALEFVDVPLGEVVVDFGGNRSPSAQRPSLEAAVWTAAGEAALSEVAANERCIIVHASKDLEDESWARTAFVGVGIPGADCRAADAIEYAIVFEQDDAAVAAHELLHLFGADDLYSRRVVEHEFKEGFLRRAIMFSTCGELKGKVIGGTTAQLIGWR